MASTSEITQLRKNIGEHDASGGYDDEYLEGLIDASDVTGATIAVWREKAAKFSGLVDTTEAGASHKASDLFRHAKEMLTTWESVNSTVTVETNERVRVKRIVRT
jgi:hypothetical protein